jgi:TRAP-type mannitol/chloroaromatic compound transport system substrate-binding protein
MTRLLTTAALAALLAGSATAETFRMQTFLGPTAATTTAFEAMADRLRTETGGAIDITVLPGGAVVGVLETLGAIEAGLLDGQYTAPSYFAGRDPAMGVLGDTLAAYPDALTQIRWFSEGGGLELARELYAGYGLHYICPLYWPEEQIPSMVPINTVADFQGLRMRAPGGLASDLLNRAGAALVTMGVGDSVTALQTGALDAVDLAYLGFNTSLGLHDTAKYSILARHSMATTEMSVSLDKWNALSPEHQAAFEAACHALDADLRRIMAAEDAAALARVAELGVTMIEFGEAEASTFRAMTGEVWDDWGSRSEMAGRIVASHRAFLASLGLN